MATNSQIRANRKNAQRSTGPRTASGKSSSARNALTRGLFTKGDFVRRNEQAEYDELCARCVTELRPEGVLEESFVLAIISAAWRQRRCSLVEREQVKGTRRDPMAEAYLERFQNAVDRARSQAVLQLRRATIELRRLQTDRAIAKQLLSNEDLPPLVDTKQLVTVIDVRKRAEHRVAQLAQLKPNQSKLASNCAGDQSARPYPHNDGTKPKNPGQGEQPALGPLPQAA